MIFLLAERISGGICDKLVVRVENIRLLAWNRKFRLLQSLRSINGRWVQAAEKAVVSGGEAGDELGFCETGLKV